MTPPSEPTDPPRIEPAAGRRLGVGPEALARAAAVLRAGGLVAFPTETVYGLGADARNPEAVARIFAAKGRPTDNPLIAHVADLPTAARLVALVTPLAERLAAAWWPGPLTLVVPARPDVPRPTTGGLDTVAVRCPDHPVARGLLARSGLAVAAPSANRSGRPSPTTAAHVLRDLGDVVDLVVDGGPCRYGVESTVVDATGATPVVLRDGVVTREQLLDAGAGGDGLRRRSPGTAHRHYAPSCPVEVLPAAHLPARAAVLTAAGRHVGRIEPEGVDDGAGVPLLRYASVDDLARGLFAALRTAEDIGCDVVLAAAVEERGLGRAVMDRLRRASAATRQDGQGAARQI